MPKRRKAGSDRGRIALWHSLAHIEFVAIDLALDMAGRFGGEMNPDFVSDFLQIAAEEAMHFALLDRYLHSLGSFYGALPAHGGLWDAAHETRHDRWSWKRGGWTLPRRCWIACAQREMSEPRRSYSESLTMRFATSRQA
jgi:uncharacterized ferritin-like protein (DUF455 family)